MKILQICLPHLSVVTTLPWKSRKSFFYIIIHILQIIYVTSEENKYQLLYRSFSCLLTVVCASCPIVLRLGYAAGGARVLIRTCRGLLRQRLVATWAEFQHSVVYYAKDWKHVFMQTVITLYTCGHIACLTFSCHTSQPVLFRATDDNPKLALFRASDV